MERNEHNDLLIQQLRSEIYQLKKSEEDYYLLQEQLNRLETKYRLLSDEKISNDRQHQSKHDSYTKLIQQTKHQLVVLQDQLKYKQTDLKEIDTEGLNLKRLCEQKNSEIERLRIQRNSLLAEDEELKLEDERIDHQMMRMQGEIHNLKSEYERAQNQYQNSFDRNREHEKYLGDLVSEGKSFMEDIRTFEDRIMNTENELQLRTDSIRGVEKQISDATSASKELEIDLAEVTSQNEKYKGEINHYLRLGQSEVARANDIIRSIQVLESSIKMINEESLEVRQEIEELEKENIQVADVNMKIELDSENSEKHIELLGSQNQHLMGELDKLAEEDEVVRALLTRKKVSGFDVRGMGMGMGLGSRVKGDSGSAKLSRTSHQSRF